mmetsp:Transcript_22077/g.55349  ORF Transcript_22077/g.55349 Transcript_22077/m.55349 type:complete len:318 (+) Transcript_22077:87-1040(+)|eukprot:CAMPEP_0173421732 /NCGR_PEP_ID=MMETSP1357-20121228/2728_1 /TAXON_ID=77926 /ORGANISM="Hemiselmis rufescens, Strain PCC563" /LENGTH=317 /DNA_ID=CAMNT_0014384675 /DNA_START=79 /DNA_END=1032 /DNA_ORIENTATION=+
MTAMLSDSLECARLLSSLSAIHAQSVPVAPPSASDHPKKASIDWFLSGNGVAGAPPQLPAPAALSYGVGMGLPIHSSLGMTPSGTASISSPLGPSALPAPSSAPFPNMVAHDLGPALALLISGMVAPKGFQVTPRDVHQPASTIRPSAPDAIASKGAANPRKRGAPDTPPLDLDAVVQRKRAAHDDGGKASLCATPDSTWSRASTTDGNCSSNASDVDASDCSERGSQTIALDCATAADIYRRRPTDAGTKYGSMACASHLASVYDVSPKTIRDIWNRKSWVKATRPLWTEEEKKDHVPRSHRSREERRGKLRRPVA